MAQMESAGMFSITARAEDEVLQLATGKDISVQVPSKNSDANFNLYYFDSIKNTWVKTVGALPTSQNEPTVVSNNKPSLEIQKKSGSEYATINV